MVTDQQVRRLRKLMQRERTLLSAAAKAGMDEKTARKYLREEKLPSEMKAERYWRTRPDPYEEVWKELESKLKINPGLEAKTLFMDLQRRCPGLYQDGQLRTLQRRVKAWRALEGPPKEVFFDQEYRPGELCQSDFTSMNSLEISIQGQVFEHLLYHFVLAYSNWEWGTVCFSESFESLSEGLQNALWELGGTPKAHRTDRMSSAVHQDIHPESFTQRYRALLRHYRLEGLHIQVAKPHENGDVEQRHHRFKVALDQALMLRGSRDFASREEYVFFLVKLFHQLNGGRQERQKQELEQLGRLPMKRLDACKRIRVRVSRGSTIRAANNLYSVHSRLIGEMVEARIYAEHIEVWYAQRQVERLPRLRGQRKHRIQYRHIIDWLVRKPGAFENYRYRKDMFPTSRFRIAYDTLKKQHSTARASREYLQSLQHAAMAGESLVDAALGQLTQQSKPISLMAVKQLLESGNKIKAWKEVEVQPVALAGYDELLEAWEVVPC